MTLVGIALLFIPVNTKVYANTALGQDNNVSDRVRVTDGQIEIIADHLTYDTENGIVEASGNVIVNTQNAAYHTEFLTYNLKDATGKTSTFNGVLKSEPRDYKISGDSLTLSKERTTLLGASVTRCLLPKPEYEYSAKEIVIEKPVIHLKQVTLRIKGIPVFYLPKLSLNFDKKTPDVQLGYNDDDGIKVKYNYLAALTSNLNWFLNGELTAKDESEISWGLESMYRNFKNRIGFQYNLDNYFTIFDQLFYETDHLAFTADGFRDFSNTDERQYGARLTRKYWDTPIGRWQIGFLARNAYKFEHSTRYGGFYTGWQLDYNPYQNLTISYLNIDSHSNREYDDLMDDYGVGDNWLYNWGIPIKNGYVLNLNGVYNSDGDGWIHQVYSLDRETCCFKTSIGYDFGEDSWEISWKVKF